MADANRTNSPLRGIGFIERRPGAEGKHRKLRDDEIMYERLSDCVRYTGTATALVGAGIIEEHMLPGQPDRDSTTVLIAGPDGGKRGPGSIEITRTDAGLFDVRVGFSGGEGERRAEAREKQSEQAAKALQAALEREARELSQLPRSHEQYRDHCVKTLRAHIKIVRDTAIVANKYSGYHFDSLAVRAFDDAAMRLLKTLLYGGTVFNAAVQERRIIEIRSPGSKVNLPLQNFLQNVTAQSDDATADDEGA